MTLTYWLLLTTACLPLIECGGVYSAYIWAIVEQSDEAVATAVIIRSDGKMLTSRSDESGNDLTIQEDEKDSIVNAMTSEEFTDFMIHGISIDRTKYRFMSAKEDGAGYIVTAKNRKKGTILILSSEHVIGVAFVPKRNENRISKAKQGLHFGIDVIEDKNYRGRKQSNTEYKAFYIHLLDFIYALSLLVCYW